MLSSSGSSQPRDQTHISSTTWEAPKTSYSKIIQLITSRGNTQTTIQLIYA